MKDKVALITGGAGNIGWSVTRAFLEAGARVAVPFHGTDRPDALESLKSEHGDRMLEFALDLTTERGTTAAVRQTVEWQGRLDVVAHLIGGYWGGSPIAETPLDAWERMIDLNLRSAWLMAHEAIPAMQEGNGGSFVFVSSRAARVGRRGNAAYAISKAGLLTLVESIAEEYRGEGIRANAVLPGVVDTDDNRRAMPDADHDRWTHPEDIARVIVFLASSSATAVNGAAVPVYGMS
jgi:NAD(P)-dependent dehydrogenase (short-subunit alcohol dehydrogenase family)